jgi:hypothetical protein
MALDDLIYACSQDDSFMELAEMYRWLHKHGISHEAYYELKQLSVLNDSVKFSSFPSRYKDLAKRVVKRINPLLNVKLHVVNPNIPNETVPYIPISQMIALWLTDKTCRYLNNDTTCLTC